ncbi:hypothetical protein DMENIID0001_168150 [Sergentomyia squamirostris]
MTTTRSSARLTEMKVKESLIEEDNKTPQNSEEKPVEKVESEESLLAAKVENESPEKKSTECAGKIEVVSPKKEIKENEKKEEVTEQYDPEFETGLSGEELNGTLDSSIVNISQDSGKEDNDDPVDLTLDDQLDQDGGIDFSLDVDDQIQEGDPIKKNEKWYNLPIEKMSKPRTRKPFSQMTLEEKRAFKLLQRKYQRYVDSLKKKKQEAEANKVAENSGSDTAETLTLSGAADRRYKMMVSRGYPKTLETKLLARESLSEIYTEISNKQSKKRPPPGVLDGDPAAKMARMTELSEEIVFDENAELEPEFITIRILPDNFPSSFLSEVQMPLIQEAIINKVFQQRVKQPKPQFTDCKFHSGWMTVGCCNKITANWLKEITATLEPYPNAKLIAVEEEDVCTIPEIFEMYLPNSQQIKNFEIITFLEAQNNGFTMKHWSLIKREVEGSFVKLTISVKPKLNQLLKKRNYKLFYRFGQIQLTKPAPKPPKASPHPPEQKPPQPQAPSMTLEERKEQEYFRHMNYGRGKPRGRPTPPRGKSSSSSMYSPGMSRSGSFTPRAPRRGGRGRGGFRGSSGGSSSFPSLLDDSWDDERDFHGGGGNDYRFNFI